MGSTKSAQQELEVQAQVLAVKAQAVVAKVQALAKVRRGTMSLRNLNNDLLNYTNHQDCCNQSASAHSQCSSSGPEQRQKG